MKHHIPAWWHKNQSAPWYYRWILSTLAFVYGFITRVRRKILKPRACPLPVVSVGNVVVGGAGKTPLVRALCHNLRAMGQTPHVLMRGYGGRLKGIHQVNPDLHTSQDVGDEAIYLSQNGETVWIGANRYASAQKAYDSGATILILDDGHQDLTLAKDFRIVVIDAIFGLGNGCVMPAGPLREPMDLTWHEADHIIIVGDIPDPLNNVTIPQIPCEIIKPQFQMPHQPNAPKELLPLHRPVVAFSGIGLPEKFHASLTHAGYQILEWVTFPDHHIFSTEELSQLQRSAAKYGAALVTTAKDYARLPDPFKRMIFMADINFGELNDPILISMIYKILGVFSRKACK